MFLTTCKTALELVSFAWQQKVRNQWKWEIEHWSENLETPEDEISKKLASRIDYLIEASKEFEELLLKDTQKVSIQESINDLSMEIANAYLYVDEASDWICAQKIKRFDEK